jgi:hypothetical protein
VGIGRTVRLLIGVLTFRLLPGEWMAYGIVWLWQMWWPGVRRMPDKLADEAGDPPRRQHWRDSRRHLTVEWRRWDAGL